MQIGGVAREPTFGRPIVRGQGLRTGAIPRLTGLSLLQEVAEAVRAAAGGDASFSGLDHPVEHADAFADHGGHIGDKAGLLRLGGAQIGLANSGAHTGWS